MIDLSYKNNYIFWFIQRNIEEVNIFSRLEKVEDICLIYPSFCYEIIIKDNFDGFISNSCSEKCGFDLPAGRVQNLSVMGGFFNWIFSKFCRKVFVFIVAKSKLHSSFHFFLLIGNKIRRKGIESI